MSKHLRTIIVLSVLVSFILSSIQIPVYAQIGSASLTTSDPMPFMPKPGVMVPLSPEYTPAYLKGIVIHPENALKFDFIIYKGDKPLTDAQKREEYTKLTKYFLASLAIPDDDQWVNLSPYEKDRIIKDDFGKTEMGRDLLAQDYLLKQITASLIYPEDNLGKQFWQKVYTQAQQQYGTTDIAVNTFNKVWILPDDALIYEKGNTAYVLKNHLRVMLEEDYLSLAKHSGITSGSIANSSSSVIARSSFPRVIARSPAKRDDEVISKRTTNNTHSIASKIVKAIILPELQREVNEDKNFAPLRQVYSGMLLATWFKRTLKQSLLGQIYANKAKIAGIDYPVSKGPIASLGEKVVSLRGVPLPVSLRGGLRQDGLPTKQSFSTDTIESIYQRYLQAYKKGVFNFIKEDTDRLTNETIPRKYFSGGLENDYAQAMRVTFNPSPAMENQVKNDMNNLEVADLAMVEAKSDAAMVPEQVRQLRSIVEFIDSVNTENITEKAEDLRNRTDFYIEQFGGWEFMKVSLKIFWGLRALKDHGAFKKAELALAEQDLREKENKVILPSQAAKASIEKYIAALDLANQRISGVTDPKANQYKDILSREEIQSDDIEIILKLPTDVLQVFERFFQARVYEVVSELRQKLRGPIVSIALKKASPILDKIISGHPANSLDKETLKTSGYSEIIHLSVLLDSLDKIHAIQKSQNQPVEDAAMRGEKEDGAMIGYPGENMILYLDQLYERHSPAGYNNLNNYIKSLSVDEQQGYNNEVEEDMKRQVDDKWAEFLQELVQPFSRFAPKQSLIDRIRKRTRRGYGFSTGAMLDIFEGHIRFDSITIDKLVQVAENIDPDLPSEVTSLGVNVQQFLQEAQSDDFLNLFRKKYRSSLNFIFRHRGDAAMVKEIVKLTIEMLDASDIETVNYAIENLSRPTFLMEDGSLSMDNVNAAVDALEAFKGPQGNIYIAPEDRKEMVKEVFESWSKAGLRIVPRQTRRYGPGDAAMRGQDGAMKTTSEPPQSSQYIR